MNSLPRIGILIGSYLPPNEENELHSLGKMLSEQFRLDLVVNEDALIPQYLRKYYTVCSYSETTTKLSRMSIRNELIVGVVILHRYVGEEHPHLLFHLTKPQTYGLAVALIARIHGLPFIIRKAGDILNAYDRESVLVRKAYLFLRVTYAALVAFRLAPQIVTIGERLCAELVGRGIDRNKIEIIPQPIDRERFRPPTDKAAHKRALGLPTNRRVLLFVGRLSKLAAVDIMPQIIVHVLQANDGFVFCFVGPYSPYAEQLCESGGNAVRIVGPVAHTEIADYYKAADLLIHISDSEGSIPHSVLEALACNVPICTNRVGEIEQITTHVFDTPEEFAAYILDSKWSLDPLPQQFKWEHLKSQYIECVRTVLTANSRQGSG